MKRTDTHYEIVGNIQKQNSERGNSGDVPSIIWALLYTSFYLFSAIPIVFGIVYALIIAGYPATSIKLMSGVLIYSVQIIVAISISIILFKKYERFLFGIGWKEKSVRILNTGFKWARPIIVVYFVFDPFKLPKF